MNTNSSIALDTASADRDPIDFVVIDKMNGDVIHATVEMDHSEVSDMAEALGVACPRSDDFKVRVRTGDPDCGDAVELDGNLEGDEARLADALLGEFRREIGCAVIVEAKRQEEDDRARDAKCTLANIRALTDKVVDLNGKIKDALARRDEFDVEDLGSDRNHAIAEIEGIINSAVSLVDYEFVPETETISARIKIKEPLVQEIANEIGAVNTGNALRIDIHDYLDWEFASDGQTPLDRALISLVSGSYFSLNVGGIAAAIVRHVRREFDPTRFYDVSITDAGVQWIRKILNGSVSADEIRSVVPDSFTGRDAREWDRTISIGGRHFDGRECVVFTRKSDGKPSLKRWSGEYFRQTSL